MLSKQIKQKEQKEVCQSDLLSLAKAERPKPKKTDEQLSEDIVQGISSTIEKIILIS